VGVFWFGQWGKFWVLTPAVATRTVTAEKNMKKLMGMMLAACMVAGFSMAQVTSLNVVGYQTMTVKPGFNLLSLNFDVPTNTPTSIKIQSVFTTNGLVAGFTIGTSDAIQIWNGSGFGIYWYRAYKATPPNQFTGGPAWVNANTPTTVSADTIPSGTGFWFVHTGTATNQLTSFGQVVVAATNSVALHTGFNMIGSAYPTAFPLNTGTPFNWATATAGFTIGTSDAIQIWNGSAFAI
jgi:hypothetical protein